MLTEVPLLIPDPTDTQRDAVLAQYRASGSTVNTPPTDLTPASLRHAYATQVARLSRLGASRAAGYRLCGANEHARATFDTDRVFFAMMAPNDLVDGARPSRSGWLAPMGEPHIALAVSETLPPRVDAYALDDLANLISWVAPALDICDPVFTQPQSAGLTWMIADSCGMGGLVLGERLGAHCLSELEQSLVIMVYGDEPVSFGTGEALINGALGTLQDFLLTMGGLGLPLHAGLPIGLGGCAPGAPLPPGGDITVRFGDAAEMTITI